MPRGYRVAGTVFALCTSLQKLAWLHERGRDGRAAQSVCGLHHTGRRAMLLLRLQADGVERLHIQECPYAAGCELDSGGRPMTDNWLPAPHRRPNIGEGRRKGLACEMRLATSPARCERVWAECCVRYAGGTSIVAMDWDETLCILPGFSHWKLAASIKEGMRYVYDS